MKTKLHCWLADYEGQGWSDALPDIALGMNRQTHSTIGDKMPYEIFFNRKPRWEERVVAAPNIQVDQIEEALFDESEQETLGNQV